MNLENLYFNQLLYCALCVALGNPLESHDKYEEHSSPVDHLSEKNSLYQFSVMQYKCNHKWALSWNVRTDSWWENEIQFADCVWTASTENACCSLELWQNPVKIPVPYHFTVNDNFIWTKGLFTYAPTGLHHIFQHVLRLGQCLQHPSHKVC